LYGRGTIGTFEQERTSPLAESNTLLETLSQIPQTQVKKERKKPLQVFEQDVKMYNGGVSTGGNCAQLSLTIYMYPLQPPPCLSVPVLSVSLPVSVYLWLTLRLFCCGCVSLSFSLWF
jgi:hypothetical protein